MTEVSKEELETLVDLISKTARELEYWTSSFSPDEDPGIAVARALETFIQITALNRKKFDWCFQVSQRSLQKNYAV